MKITLGGILSWLAGIFFLLIGLVGLASAPLGGLIALVVGAFALPPARQRITERSGVEFSRWVVVAVVVVGGGVGMGIIGSSVNGDAGPTDGGAEDIEATESPTPTAEASFVHDMGESFVVGSGDQSVRYTVQDAYWADRILGFQTEEPEGVYVVLILEMENVGDESFDVTDRHMKLVDQDDREFSADFDATFAVSEDSRIEAEGVTFDQLQPGLTVERAVVYDVVPDQEYRFKIEPVGVFSGADEHFVELEIVELE